jgi:hypothetical protein
MVSDHTSHVICVGNLSLVPTRSKQGPTPGRSLRDQRETGPAIALDNLILLSSRQPCSRGKRFWLGGYIATSAYWAHKHQHVISTFNTCSSVLNQHRRGLQPWRCHHATSHSPTFPNDGLQFPPTGPARSPANHANINRLQYECIRTYHRHMVFRPLGIYRHLCLCIAIANVLQILARSSSITWKVLIMHLRSQSTPTNLMHKHI